MEPREVKDGSPVSSQRRENKLAEIMAARIFEAKRHNLTMSKKITFTHNACDWGKNRSREVHHIEEPGCLSEWSKRDDEKV